MVEFNANKKQVIIAIPKEKLHYIKEKNIELTAKNKIEVDKKGYSQNEYNFYQIENKDKIIIKFHDNDVEKECEVWSE